MKSLSARRITVGISVLALGFAVLGASPAMAVGTPASDPTVVSTTTKTTPMVFGGYDASVAKANGFRIVTAKNGTQTSVPVTRAAKLAAKSFVAPKSGASTNAVVPGTCGTSFLTAAKLSNDNLAINTGYSVGFPVLEKHWSVNAVGFVTGHSFAFSTAGTAASWSAQAAATVVGPGVAIVPLTSIVIGANGKICHSNGPTASFG